MALLYEIPLSDSFSGVGLLEANGTSATGDSLPSGIGDSIYIESGHMVSNLRETDAATGFGKRCEIVPGAPDGLGDDRWYTFDWMAPHGWPLSDGCSGNKLFAIMQVHDTAGPARCPCFELFYDGIGLVASIPNLVPPVESEAYRGMGAIRANQGVWHSVALHAKWSNSSSGLLVLYINRRPIFKLDSIGTAYNADAPFLKLGTYNYHGLTGWGSRKSHHRNVRVYSGGDSLVDVLGGHPLCRWF